VGLDEYCSLPLLTSGFFGVGPIGWNAIGRILERVR
jgi:hypothetical protein